MCPAVPAPLAEHPPWAPKNGKKTRPDQKWRPGQQKWRPGRQKWRHWRQKGRAGRQESGAHPDRRPRRRHPAPRRCHRVDRRRHAAPRRRASAPRCRHSFPGRGHPAPGRRHLAPRRQRGPVAAPAPRAVANPSRVVASPPPVVDTPPRVGSAAHVLGTSPPVAASAPPIVGTPSPVAAPAPPVLATSAPVVDTTPPPFGSLFLPTSVAIELEMATTAAGGAGAGDAPPLPASGASDAGGPRLGAEEESSLHLPVLEVGPRRAKRTLTAEKVVECLVVPSYPQTSSSTTSGVLTMVPVASVETGLSPKSFVAYKSPGGKSRKLSDQLSLSFGFCTYSWTEYPCSGVDACTNVPRAVLDISHTALEAGDADQYAVYEKVFAEASSETASADTEQQALAKEWDKYTSVVAPFQHKQCPNVLCARLGTPPKGKVVTIRLSGRKFLGCAGYSSVNRMNHKNASIANIQNMSNIESWMSDERYVPMRVGDAARFEDDSGARRAIFFHDARRGRFGAPFHSPPPFPPMAVRPRLPLINGRHDDSAVDPPRSRALRQARPSTISPRGRRRYMDPAPLLVTVAGGAAFPAYLSQWHMARSSAHARPRSTVAPSARQLFHGGHCRRTHLPATDDPPVVPWASIRRRRQRGGPQ